MHRSQDIKKQTNAWLWLLFWASRVIWSLHWTHDIPSTSCAWRDCTWSSSSLTLRIRSHVGIKSYYYIFQEGNQNRNHFFPKRRDNLLACFRTLFWSCSVQHFDEFVCNFGTSFVRSELYLNLKSNLGCLYEARTWSHVHMHFLELLTLKWSMVPRQPCKIIISVQQFATV